MRKVPFCFQLKGQIQQGQSKEKHSWGNKRKEALTTQRCLDLQQKNPTVVP